MSGKIARVALIIVLLMGLASCNKQIKPVTEEVIREDLETAFAVDGSLIKINKLVVHAVTINGDQSTATITMELEDSQAISTLDVELHYTLSKNAWVYDSRSYDFVSAYTKTEPVIQKVREFVLAVQQGKQAYFSFFDASKLVVDYENDMTQMTPDRDNATVVITFESMYHLLHTQVTATMDIKGSYEYGKGWTFTIDDWTYVERTQFYHQIFITFPSPLPQSDQWFSAGEKATIELDGEQVLTVNETQGMVFTNTLHSDMIINDIRIPSVVTSEYPENGEGLSLKSTALKIAFNDTANGYVFLWLDADHKQVEAVGPSYWKGLDGDGNPFTAEGWTYFGVAD